MHIIEVCMYIFGEEIFVSGAHGVVELFHKPTGAILRKVHVLTRRWCFSLKKCYQCCDDFVAKITKAG